jgi:hypothetical protein
MTSELKQALGVVILAVTMTAAATGGILTACTPQAQSAANATTASVVAGCQVIVTATDPALLPVCVTAAALEQAIQAIILDVEAARAEVLEGGASHAMLPAISPSSDEIYTYLVAHGAQTIQVTK